MDAELFFPFRGAVSNGAYIKTPGDAAPLIALRNCRTTDISTGRPRGSKRPGITKALATRIGTGRVQALATVTRASAISGYVYGAAQSMGAGTSIESGPLVGQVWGVGDGPSLSLTHHMDVTSGGPYAENGPSDNVVNACCTSPDGRYLVVGSNYLVGGVLQARIECIEIATGAVIQSRTITESGVARYINTMCASNNTLYVCTNEHVNRWSMPFLNALQLDQNTLNGWCDETVQAAVSPDGQSLYVGFIGSQQGATLPNGPTVTGGLYGACFRSGVMKFKINLLGGLVQQTFGTQLPSSHVYYEADHRYFRLSEQFPSAPRGALITALTVAPDGGVIIAHTNTGRGPNASFPPDGSTGYATVSRITPEGVLDWQVDTDSIKEVGDLGYFNDIPTPWGNPTDFPSIQALACDSSGNVYAAGRRNAGGYNVFKITGTGQFKGVEEWRADLGGTILQAAAAVDPGDNAPVFAGVRNTGWPGASGANAHLWKLLPVTGGLAWHFDLGEAVDGLCVCTRPASSGPRVFYGTNKVS